jgi:hypothetical protein
MSSLPGYKSFRAKPQYYRSAPNLYLFRSVVLQVANVADVLGVAKKTPMGIFLKEWGVEPDLKYIS